MGGINLVALKRRTNKFYDYDTWTTLCVRDGNK